MNHARLLAAIVFVSGCTGDLVEAPRDTGADDAAVDGAGDVAPTDGAPTDGAPTDTAPTDTGDAGCTTVPGNVVQNPSFELASGGVPTGWLASSVLSLAQKTGGAAHCAAWAEVHLAGASTSAPVYFSQDVLLDAPLAKGARIVATAWFRTLDTNTVAELVVGVVGGDYRSKVVSLSLDGTWKQATVEWVATAAEEGQKKLYVGLTSALLTARAVGVDHVTLVVSPP